jgi:hypothetical protein
MEEKEKFDFNKLNTKIEKADWYIFMKRHERVIKIIEGFIIIGLLIGLNSYLFKDRQLKEQIAANCGYTTNEYQCVCDKNFVDAYKGFSGLSELNFTIANSSDNDE